MIQAPLPKPVETPKAQPKVDRSEVSSNSKVRSKEAKTTGEAKESKAKNEFAEELEAELKAGEVAVNPVEVTTEQVLDLPSTLVGPEGTEIEQKVFDPALTKDVDSLIAPKNTKAEKIVQPMIAEGEALNGVEAQLEMATELDPELKQALLKSPQVTDKGSRSPAIDFAKGEVEPQLLSNEDFVAQKNLVSKKASPNAYGMKTLPAQQQKLALESGLNPNQLVKESSALEQAPMNSQEFILGLQAAPKNQQQAEVQSSPKIFDMTAVKTTDSNEIMNQITDYVVQAKAAKEPTVNMRVNHEELGMIDITVSRVGVGQDALSVNIGAHTLDGKNFFQQNSKELFTHLTTAGINVADFKVETPSQTAKNDFDFGSQSGRNNQGSSEKQFGSEQNQRRHESERRQDLWKLLNKEAA
jgi:hypothetical protein